ncbi:MAG: RDD family protein, partial [Cyanobacteria bacterium J06632_22]
MVLPVNPSPATGALVASVRPPVDSTVDPTIDLVAAGPMPALRLRRLGAWVAEAGLVALSGLLPFGLGLAATRTSMATVPLNPLLTTVQHRTAETLQLPKSDLKSAVPPLTNLLWTVGLLAPIGVSGWQLLRLQRTGQTLPKAWLRLRVVYPQADMPSLPWQTVIVRESARWGLPLALTYGVGLASGVALGSWVPVVAGLGYLGWGLTGLRDRTPWY